MPKYKFLNAGGPITFPLSTVFVDKYMPDANATFVKVYLYGLRLCYATGEETDNKKIAAALDILETDVLKAFEYWESKGIVRIGEDGGIEFMDLSADVEYKKPRKPSYKTTEIACILDNNSDIKQLVVHTENIFGKTLSMPETSTLFSFYDWLRLPVEVILMLLEYCASLQKLSMAYAEKVAVSWAEKGIDSIDKARDYLTTSEKRDKLSRVYKKILGTRKSTFTDAEYAHIIQWTEGMKMSQELIKRAAQKAQLVTGDISFPYINGILNSWYKQGITREDELVRDEKPGTPPKPKARPAGGKNKFVNYSQDGDYDFDEIEKKMQDKRMNG